MGKEEEKVMELGKAKNLLQPENRRLIPLVAYGLVKGLARMAVHEIMGPPKEIQERQAASIQYYSTGEAETKRDAE